MAVFDDAVFLWHPGDVTTRSFDLATVANSSTGLPEGSIVTHLGKTGRVHASSVGSRFDISPFLNLHPGQSWSAFAISRLTATGWQESLWFGLASQPDRYAQIRVRRGQEGESSVRIDSAVAGDPTWPFVLTPDEASSGDFVVSIVTYESTGASTATLTVYQDSNVPIGSDTITTSSALALNRITVGRADDSTPLNSTAGETYAAGIWDRVLTSGEIDEILLNPFSYLDDTDARVRVSRLAVEVLQQDPNPDRRISRLILEVLQQDPNPETRLSRLSLEVLQSVVVGLGISGGSTASILIDSEAAGFKMASGGSAASISVAPTGNGAKFIGSAATAIVDVLSGGTGLKATSEGALASINIAPIGNGTKSSFGEAMASVLVNALGGGGKVVESGSSASMNVAVIGEGHKTGIQGTTSSILINSLGDGFKMMSFGTFSLLLISAFGEGGNTRPEGGSVASVQINSRSGGQLLSMAEFIYVLDTTRQPAMILKEVDVDGKVTETIIVKEDSVRIELRPIE